MLYVLFDTVYLIEETVQMMGSNGKAVRDAIDVLRQRLQHRSPVTKQKALRLVKESYLKGSSELRRALTRELSSLVRELIHFRCAPDAFKGDIPWKRVQQAAREALDTLHAAPGTHSATKTSNTLGSRIQGFGSDSQNRSNMVGFGSDSYSGGASYGETPASGLLTANGADRTNTGSMMGSFSSSFREIKDRAVGSMTRSQHTRLASNDSIDLHSREPLQGWGNDGHVYKEQFSPSSTGPQLESKSQSNIGSSLSPSLQGSEPTMARATAEDKLVQRICQPKGVRATPSTEELRTFSRAAIKLNGKKIGIALQKVFESGSWQEILRSLCALESLLEQSTTTTAGGEVAVHFQTQEPLACLRRLRQSNQTTVKQRSARVLELLGEETLEGSNKDTTAVAGTATKAASASFDLLDSGSTQPAAVQEPSGSAKEIDLLHELESLSVSDTKPHVEQRSSNLVDLGSGLEREPPAASSTNDDFFGEWTSTAHGDYPMGFGDASKESMRVDNSFDQLDLLGGISNAPLESTMQQQPTSSQSGSNEANNILPVDFFSSNLTPAPAMYATPSLSSVGSRAMRNTQPASGSLAPATSTMHSSGAILHARNASVEVMHAAASGITTVQRGDAAFEGLVFNAMESMKRKESNSKN